VLLSMTGHGQAEINSNGLTVNVELRTINSRYLKLSLRSNEASLLLEPLVEQVVRRTIRRGTIQVNMRLLRLHSGEDYRLNTEVLEGYRRQLMTYQSDRATDHIPLTALLTLPGVVSEPVGDEGRIREEWPVIESALVQAIERLEQMRRKEGDAMAKDLRENCKVIADQLESVVQRAPTVIAAYQTRLIERMNGLLSNVQTEVQSSDVVREVGVFSERCDISEEIVRLKSHLHQFELIMDDKESNGRKLEFLSQEVFREINTIGSKANDSQIATHVVEMKTAVERIREMIQNVE
jgi:uncharacterized protein (TIGR00255 family)